MYIKNNTAKLIYRLNFLFFCALGVILQYVIVSKIGHPEMLICYYTILSNLVCFFYYLYLVIRRPEKENPMIKCCIVICITITNLGYHFLLNGAMEQGVGAMKEIGFVDILSNNLVHYIVPFMTIIDYFLFTPKGEYKWYYPFACTILPFVYVVFAMVRPLISDSLFDGFNGKSPYPYPFLDVDAFGWGKILLIIFAMFVGVIALSYISYGVDKLLNYWDKKRNEKQLVSVANNNTELSSNSNNEQKENEEDKEEDEKEISSSQNEKKENEEIKNLKEDKNSKK